MIGWRRSRFTLPLSRDSTSESSHRQIRRKQANGVTNKEEKGTMNNLHMRSSVCVCFGIMNHLYNNQTYLILIAMEAKRSSNSNSNLLIASA